MTAAVLTLPDDERLAEQELIVVNAPDYLSYVSQAGSTLLLHGRPMPASIRGLAIGPSAVTVWRVDERTLDLSLAEGYLSGPFGGLFRDPREPLAEGDLFAVPGMTATVLSLTPAALPATVRFRFDRPLEAPGRRWVQFRDGGFVPFTPPETGSSVELPAARGPLELFLE